MIWLRRVWHLLNRSRRERELVLEMQEHRASMNDPSTFGDTHRWLEQSRDVWGWNWLDDAVQDLRFALRGLMRAPVFTVTAILILSFGIGLNLTVFQMANVVLLNAPKLSRPDNLARLHRHGKSLRANSEAVPYVLSQAVARNTDALSSVFVEASEIVVWDEHTAAKGSFVSANRFSELDQAALYGRAFSPQIDAASDAPPSVVIGYRFWKRALGGDRSVIGAVAHINKHAVTVIGVMPESTAELDLQQSDLWLLIDQHNYYFPDSSFLTDWESNNVSMYARLRGDLPVSDVRESIRGVMAALHVDQPAHVDADEWLEPALAATNFTEPAERLGFIGVASTIGLLSTLVLMVAATNLGNLVLSRVSSRSRELGVRIALGARRSRIVRQLAIETLPLGVSGAAGGLLFAIWAANTIAALGGLPPYLDFTPDLAAIAVSGVWMMAALGVIGALPAWKVSKQDLTDAIKDGGQQVSMRLDRARMRSIMLAAQVAGSCVILIVSAMMVRSLQQALMVNPGFNYENSVVVEAGLAQAGVTADAAKSYWMRFNERIAASPEAGPTALVLTAPFSGRGMLTRFTEAPRLSIATNHVEPAFFSVMDIPLLAGRSFDARDDATTAVVISRSLAQAMYGTTDVVGRSFPRSEPHDTIVGIAADASFVRPGSTNSGELYRPLDLDDYQRAVLLVRARGDAARLVGVLRDATKQDPRVFAGVRLLKDDFERRVSGTEIASTIGASIGLLTLLLAGIGIFGVVSYGVTLRIKELGIHLALGASRRTVIAIATRQASLPLGAGIALGTAAAIPIGFALSKSPLQLAFADPLSYVAALMILIVAGLTAATAPVVRALQTDPIRALRHQ